MKNRKDDNASSYCYLFLIIILLALFVLLTLLLFVATTTQSPETSLMLEQGNVTLKELDANVYRKFGYRIRKPTLPIPTLEMIAEPTCGQVFANWTRIAEQPQPEVPPDRFPDGLEMQYLLNNYSAVIYKYSNDKQSPTGEKPRNWDRIGELMTWQADKIAALAYGPEGLSVNYAMQAYPLINQSGIVIGSMQPWVEVFALKNGATKILTAEYNPLVIPPEFQDRMSTVQPVQFAENWRIYADSFDFAVSFSSIEHSGMGRYGDPIDPIGDIREMLKIKCILKKGGLLFVGFPAGPDAITFNLHRIYGPIRFAMMMTGYQLIAVFSGFDPNPIDLTSSKLIFSNKQNTFVLRKL